jgi:hypothetical protein
MADSQFTIILDLQIADTDAGYILQWDTYYFKFAVYQTENQKIQFIWIDKGLLDIYSKGLQLAAGKFPKICWMTNINFRLK